MDGQAAAHLLSRTSGGPKWGSSRSGGRDDPLDDGVDQRREAVDGHPLGQGAGRLLPGNLVLTYGRTAPSSDGPDSRHATGGPDAG